MTTTATPDPAEIARGLTYDQALLIRRLASALARGKGLQLYQPEIADAEALERLGCVAWVDGRVFVAEPLGRAVAAVLEE